MIVKVNKPAEIQGDVKSEAFKLNVGSKAFKILSDGLYTDKMGAPVRELASNAYDAHLSINNPDPFYVHLPTVIEPFFLIRDFGPGLSQEEVFELYTTYFSSTKSDSNEYVGGFGLGSKSPFAYVDSYTVVSYNNGVKSTYALIMSQGLPSVNLIGTCPSDEKTGLEVSFPVPLHDIRDFINTAHRWLLWHDFECNIEKIELDREHYLGSYFFLTVNDIGKLRNVINCSYSTPIFLLVGKILYDITSIFSKLSLPNHTWFQKIVVKIAVGSVELTTSRENVAETPENLELITKIFRGVVDTMKPKMLEDYDKMSPTEFVDNFSNYAAFGLEFPHEEFKYAGRSLLHKKVDEIYYVYVSSPRIIDISTFNIGGYRTITIYLQKDVDMPPRVLRYMNRAYGMHYVQIVRDELEYNDYLDQHSIPPEYLIDGELYLESIPETVHQSRTSQGLLSVYSDSYTHVECKKIPEDDFFYIASYRGKFNFSYVYVFSMLGIPLHITTTTNKKIIEKYPQAIEVRKGSEWMNKLPDKTVETLRLGVLRHQFPDPKRLEMIVKDFSVIFDIDETTLMSYLNYENEELIKLLEENNRQHKIARNISNNLMAMFEILGLECSLELALITLGTDDFRKKMLYAKKGVEQLKVELSQQPTLTDLVEAELAEERELEEVTV